MRKMLIVFLSFVMISTFAQSYGPFKATDVGQTLNGFKVTIKHDTIKGSIYFASQDMMQMAFQMKDQNNQDVWDNNWHYVICYQIENNTKWFSTMRTTLKAPADPNRLTEGPESFLLCQEVGPITLFEYNFVDYKASPRTSEVKTYLQLPNGEVVDVSSLLLGYAKKMSGYVKDYPELAAKITNKEKGYGVLNINNVVREYNTWYMSKNPDFSIIKKE